MYKQLRKQVEEEKSQFQKNIQNIESIQKTPKVYQVYQPNIASQSPPSLSPSPHKQHISLPKDTSDPEIDREFLDKIKELTDIKRFEKLNKLNTQLDQLKMQYDLLTEQNQTLKGQLRQRGDQLRAVQQKLEESQQNCLKHVAQESNLKSMVLQLTAENQEKGQHIIELEAERYENEVKLEDRRKSQGRLNQQCDSLKATIQKILSIIRQLSHSLAAESEQNRKEFVSLTSETPQTQETIIQQHNNILQNSIDPEIAASITALHTAIDSLIAYNRLQRKEIGALNHLVTNSLTNSMNSQRRLEEKETQLARKDAKQKQLEKQIQDLMASQSLLQEEQSREKEGFSQQLENLQNIRKVQQEALEAASLRLANLQASLEKAQTLKAQDAEIIKGLRQLINRSTVEFESQKAQGLQRETTLTQEIQRLKTLLDNANLELQSYRQKIIEYSESQKALKSEINRFKETIKMIERKDSEGHAQIVDVENRLQAQRNEEKSENENLRLRIQQLESQIQQAILSSSRLQSDLANLTFTLHESQLQKTQLQDQLQKTIVQVQSLTQQNEKQHHQMGELEGGLKEARLAKEQQFQENEVLRIKVKQDEAILASLKEETVRMYLIERGNEQLKTNNIALKAQIEQLMQKEQINQLNELQSKLNQEKEQINTKAALIESQTIRLKKQIQILGQELKKCKEAEVSLRILHEQKISDCLEATKGKQAAIRQGEQLRRELKEQRDKWSNLQEKFMQVENQKRKACQEVQEKEKLLDKLRTEQHAASRKIKELQEKALEASDQVEQVQARQQRTPEKQKPEHELLQELCQQFAKISNNCLKNNCDSVGLINVELSKLPRDHHQNFALLSSPTDCLRFNAKKSVDLEGSNQGSKGSEHIDSKGESGNAHSRAEISPEGSDHIQEAEVRKQKKDMLISRKTNKSSHDYLMKPLEPNKKVRSSEVLEPKIKEVDQERSGVEKTNPQPSANSLENNPDLEYPALPYPLLLQKYNSLKSDLENMQQYINKVNNFNSKIKKSMAEVDHYAKFKTIDKISEKFTVLVKNNESTLNNESLEFVTEITTILSELQNYIHFIDHLSKIEPFGEYGKQVSPFNRLKKQKTILPKTQKDKQPKKTYSEGQSREEDLFEHFDTNICEYEDFQGADYPPKDISKKELKDIERYFDENKELYSEISSVKNKSLHSHNSFLNSKSELWQLGIYLKNKINEEHDEEEYHKIEVEDSDKIGAMSIDKIKGKYYRLKEKNRSLMIEKALLEQAYKKLELQENTYKMKMNKMTKEFNDSFALFCKVSGQHLRPKGDRSYRQTEEKSVQVETSELRRINKFKSCEIMSFSVENESNSQKEELSVRLKEKEKVIKEREATIEGLRSKLKVQEKEFRDVLRKIKEDRIEPLALALGKNSEDFSQFMKTIIARRSLASLNQPATQKIVEQPTPTFRKSQNYFKEFEVEPISTQPENQKKTIKILEAVGSLLNIQQSSELTEDIAIDRLQQLINNALGELKKKIYVQTIELVTEYVNRLAVLESQYDRNAKIEEYRQQLYEYLGNSEKINELIRSANGLVKKLSRESITSIDNLSINSLCEDQSRKFISERDPREEQSNMEVHGSFHDLREINERLEEKIIELEQQLKTARQSKTSRDMVIHWQEEELKQLKLSKQALEHKNAQLMNFEKEKESLQEEISKLKEKSHKKPKLYYVGH